MIDVLLGQCRAAGKCMARRAAYYCGFINQEALFNEMSTS